MFRNRGNMAVATRTGFLEYKHRTVFFERIKTIVKYYSYSRYPYSHEGPCRLANKINVIVKRRIQI